ncbi:hypothetical protein CEG14_12250 [Bordetella genomosp. 1]|uniref:DUF502 domain-containing protein n=1 Tax=Bordetella genomosp. 1 TaxID=1395607 RepID=A0A261SH58_9BORD|nr:DUF502 domain-containing protein [Bordetella genomosp. 1]MDQ8033447.1 DUF502 domain-containing protein [Bordetella sp.]OZI36714.1 hypothetical protein CEG14_12250 [Bordetella genomosp. 1]OZI59002.1 hypothetical protein CAL27_17455 [Bordetella genomosp. 1]
MSKLSRYFFRGLITILPIALTLYLLFIFLAWTESFALAFLRPFIGNFYFPGLGLTLGILMILAIGYLVSLERVQRFMTFLEMPFTNLPVIKSIYSSLKSFADYFSPAAKTTTQQVVVLRLPNQPLELVGLITRRGAEGLPAGFLPGERVAVYLPMGYMIGGYTVFVPQEWVTPIEMSVEEAMRSSLIAWMARAEAQGPASAEAAQAVQQEINAHARPQAAAPAAPPAPPAAPAPAAGEPPRQP